MNFHSHILNSSEHDARTFQRFIKQEQTDLRSGAIGKNKKQRHCQTDRKTDRQKNRKVVCNIIHKKKLILEYNIIKSAPKANKTIRLYPYIVSFYTKIKKGTPLTES